MSFPDLIKLTATGDPADGLHLAFAVVRTTKPGRKPGVEINHHGLPIFMLLDPKDAPPVEDGQTVVVKYHSQDQYVGRVWTISDLRPLLAPEGRWFLHWEDIDCHGNRDIEEVLTDPTAVYERASAILSGLMVPDEEGTQSRGVEVEVPAIVAAFPPSRSFHETLMGMTPSDEIKVETDNGTFTLKRQA